MNGAPKKGNRRHAKRLASAGYSFLIDKSAQEIVLALGKSTTKRFSHLKMTSQDI